jgi:hypothetical protein
MYGLYRHLPEETDKKSQKNTPGLRAQIWPPEYEAGVRTTCLRYSVNFVYFLYYKPLSIKPHTPVLWNQFHATTFLCVTRVGTGNKRGKTDQQTRLPPNVLTLCILCIECITSNVFQAALPAATFQVRCK